MTCECGKPLSKSDVDHLYYHSDDTEWICEPIGDDPGILVAKANAPACFPESCGYLLKEEGGSPHDEYY